MAPRAGVPRGSGSTRSPASCLRGARFESNRRKRSRKMHNAGVVVSSEESRERARWAVLLLLCLAPPGRAEDVLGDPRKRTGNASNAAGRKCRPRRLAAGRLAFDHIAHPHSRVVVRAPQNLGLRLIPLHALGCRTDPLPAFLPTE